MLEVSKLYCERDRRLLFSELSFSAKSGDVIQVVGANGAGKSTFLKIICGIYDEFEGEVSWDLGDHPLYLGHKPGVNDYLTCAENLAWLAGLHGVSLDRHAIETCLSKVDLGGYADVPCANLSEGQRKRASLARLFVLPNQVWVLDEPFSAIDQTGMTALEALIQQHVTQGGLVLLTSHQPLQQITARELVLAAGG